MRRLGVALLLVGGVATAQPMIDPVRMSGIPRPDPQQPAGSISVKLLRGDFAHPIVGVDVTLDGPGGPRTMKTDETAHAVFKDLPAGQGTYVARASAYSQVLESQPIELPASPGIRLMLVLKPDEKALLGEPDGEGRADARLGAGVVEVKVVDGDDKPLAKLDVTLAHGTMEGERKDEKHAATDERGVARFEGLAATPADGYLASVARDGAPTDSKWFKLPPASGALVALRAAAVTRDPKVLSLGRQSHLIVEVRDDDVQVVENLVVENASASPYDPGKEGFKLPLAEGAEGAQLGPEAPPSLTVAGATATWRGVLPPGETNLTVAFTIPTHDGAVEIRETVPLAMDSLALIVEHYDGMVIDGAGLQKEERSMGGRNFWMVRGPAVKGGDAFTLRLSGLPHRSTVGRDLAVAMAALIAAWGIGWSWTRRGNPVSRGKLEQRRDELLDKLAALDGAGPRGKAAKAREELLTKLERVYREIDESVV